MALHPLPVPVVRCGSCNARLTSNVGGQADYVEEGSVPVPQGRWAVDPSPRTVEVWHRGMPKGRTVREETDPAGAVVVHPDDRLDGALVDIEESSAGCCGLDGCDGPNQRCAACGSVVGTARTDCWTEKEMRFWPDRVRVSDGG